MFSIEDMTFLIFRAAN